MTAPMGPTPDQITAADPRSSAWVGANAGSGKTRVLTQRVARLLLAGAEPQTILCLTYTKAAAAEMQNRLFDMLGHWAMADEIRLGQDLAALEGRDRPIEDAERLASARRLFARALETPGGLKIQTIHAFCDALLRRFPLEAGISPRFEVLDERRSAQLLAEIRRDMAEAAIRGEDDAFDRIARWLNEDDFDKLIGAVLAKRGGFADAPLTERLAAHFGAFALAPMEDIAKDRLGRLAGPEMRDFAQLLAQGGQTEKDIGAVLAVALAASDGDISAVSDLVATVLTKKNQPRERGFPTKKVLAADSGAAALAASLNDWAVESRAAIAGHVAAGRARDLEEFAAALLTRYKAAKAIRGMLDFDDLVGHARDLLTRSDMAQWVLWKLDRGIDHLLVDEAQDTSPGQWEVIRAIAREFHAGQGAQDGARSLFVVGDEKQSIYSFQGAEPRAFGDTRDTLEAWLGEMDRRLERPGLITSFRSAPGILEFVDRVFKGSEAEGLTLGGAPVRHDASRRGDAARVDLWPLIEPDPRAEPPPFDEPLPIDAPAPGDAKRRLAGRLAGEIQRMLAEEQLPVRSGRPARAITPGDILVLVRRRDGLARGLIRALKARGVPVAGSDRLRLSDELAVQDLMALIKAVTTPDDALSLAALLRSPLFDLSEEALFALAHDRGDERLWDRLMHAQGHGDAAGVLRDMAAQADFLRPYEFLERVLIRHSGRQKLIARLGAEAEDPLDELLAAALSYEQGGAPSLVGFVAWIEAGDIQIKREMEQAAGEVRVMTVHGAKGLEAPVVILPDTMGRPQSAQGQTLLAPETDGERPPLMLWPQAQDEDDAVTAKAREAASARAEAEFSRLLYVALTRAEDWLILCGAGRPGKLAGTWYEKLDRAMAEAPGVRRCENAIGTMRRIETGPWPAAPCPEAGPSATGAAAAPLAPGWLMPAPAEARHRRLAASALGTHEREGGAGAGREAALTHGDAVHRLLETYRGGGARAMADDVFPAQALAEAGRVVEAPFAGRIFGPNSLAELAVILPVPAGEIAARLDRVVVEADEVLVVDFKTDAQPPAGPEGVREAYLAQLGAYRAALARIYPTRRIIAAILWTARAELMALPDQSVENAFDSALRKAGLTALDNTASQT